MMGVELISPNLLLRLSLKKVLLTEEVALVLG